jgi:DNA-binding NarL/FixJ family response regulator
MTTRVIVVDDHPVFREGLAASLASLPEVEVVAAACDGPEAVDLVRRVGADVVLMDLNLPSMSGVEATARILALPDPPAVLVVTMVDDDDTVVAAMTAGARGYVLKGASSDEIGAAVTTVAAGGAVFGRGVASRFLTAARSMAKRSGVGDVAMEARFTERESEIMALLAEGRSNQQISRALGLRVKTVQNYVSRILDKLQVADRTQAALRARERRRVGG